MNSFKFIEFNKRMTEIKLKMNQKKITNLQCQPKVEVKILHLITNTTLRVVLLRSQMLIIFEEDRESQDLRESQRHVRDPIITFL